MRGEKALIFYIILFLFILGFSTTASNYDLDIWARLVAGMGFVQTGHVLNHDFLSYTPTHIWYDHEWGSGVVFYLVRQFFGVAGFLFLQTALVFLIFFTISKVIKLRGTTTTTPYNFLFYYFSFMAFSYVADMPVRCQLFSFLFFTVFLYILESARNGKSKLLWFLPLIMLVWNNLHGGCVVGLGLIVLYIIGEFLNRKPFKNYIYALLGTLVVLPINPWGFDYLGFLFKANTMSRSMIMEWQSLLSKNAVITNISFNFKIFALILLFSEADFMVKQIFAKNFKFDATKILVILTTLFFAIWHVKLIPFAVISLACFLYDDFYTIFNTLTKNIFDKIATQKNILVYVIIIIFSISSIKTHGFGPYLNVFRFPLRPVEFVRINNLKGNILEDFSSGSYISYKLFPNNKIFMDGRYEEVYNPELLSLYNDFCIADDDWDKLLKLYPPDIIILNKKYPVFDKVKTDKNWKLVFDDGVSGVFVEAKKAKKHYEQPSSDINYYKKTLFDTSIDFRSRGK